MRLIPVREIGDHKSAPCSAAIQRLGIFANLALSISHRCFHLYRIVPTNTRIDRMDIDWTRIFTQLIGVSVAYVLALPVAWDREKEVRSAGLRTFPLVAVASCGYALVAMSILGSGRRQLISNNSGPDHWYRLYRRRRHPEGSWKRTRYRHSG